jgi:hypothetical protein
MRRDGTLINLTSARQGVLRDYGFVRDGAGNVYWADRSEKTTIRKRSPDGKIATHATGLPMQREGQRDTLSVP